MPVTEIVDKAAGIRITGRVLNRRGNVPSVHQVAIEVTTGDDGPQHTIFITTTEEPTIEIADETTWQLVFPF